MSAGKGNLTHLFIHAFGICPGTGVASLNGSLYVYVWGTGLISQFIRESCMERYDVEMDKWFPCPPNIFLQTGSEAGLLAYDGCLYAYGSTAVEKYTPSTQTWDSVKTLP